TLFAARVSCRPPPDITEPAVALRGERRNKQAHCFLIRESDDLVNRFGRKIPSLDYRDACRTQHAARMRRVDAACKDDSFGPTAPHRLNELLFIVLRIVRVTEQQLQTCPLQFVSDSA